MAFAILCLLSACKKTIEKNETAEATSVPGIKQIANPCETRVDNARTAAASRLTAPPSTPLVLLLDFNGELVKNSIWNPGATINCPAVPPSQLSAAAKDFIVNNVTEDFSAFSIKVTKSEAEYQAAPAARRMRCIISYNLVQQFGNVGGIAFISSMSWADNTPCFVFADILLYDQKYIAGAVSHELGHTLGLQHQSRYDPGCAQIEEYHTGLGYGILGWAPIMGLSYYQNLVTWHNGPTSLGCSETQNDMNVINAVAGIKADDYGVAFNNNTVSLPLTGTKNGILENASDKDAFSKTEANSRRIKLISNGNSDLVLEVYNTNGQLQTVYDDANGLDVNVVISGKKYLRVRSSSSQPYVPAGDGFGGYKIVTSAP